jgi:hypothetical protein
MIRQIFIPVDAAAILRTLVRAQYDDMWAWEHEKHGVYSVRSAYRLLNTTRIANNERQVEGGSGDTCWQKTLEAESAAQNQGFLVACHS